MAVETLVGETQDCDVRKTDIRMGQPQDALEVASVLKKAFTEYEPRYTKEGYVATTPDAAAILHRMQEGPLWVADCENQVVGTAAAVNKETGLYIRGMAVLPAARSHGLGQLLLEEIERFAVQNGCRRLFLSTTPFLHRAIRLYESFGFHPTNEGPHDLFGTPLFTMEKALAQRMLR
jgi:GNAT superfamily N-acetyltransferase